jgi:hypothetical protein
LVSQSLSFGVHSFTNGKKLFKWFFLAMIPMMPMLFFGLQGVTALIPLILMPMVQKLHRHCAIIYTHGGFYFIGVIT